MCRAGGVQRAKRAAGASSSSDASATLCTLPDDVISIILEKLNFGGNKRDIWAVAGTCKALHAVLARWQADIRLELGKHVSYVKYDWKPKQIAGRHQSLKHAISNPVLAP